MLTHRATRDRTSQTAAEDLVLTTITHHADALLRTARRHSLCADDASDAYQRGLEIFLRNAERVDPDRAVSWLHTVIKHEAMAVRRSRQKLVGTEEFDGDAVEALHTPAPDERMLAFEDVTRAAEALQGLKPQEVRALWMRMQGRTYKEIAAELNWTYTKVNRCVTEGRRAFLTRYAGIESGDECRRLEPVLSAFLDGELTGDNARLLRRHLRGCGGCRATVRTMPASSSWSRRAAQPSISDCSKAIAARLRSRPPSAASTARAAGPSASRPRVGPGIGSPSASRWVSSALACWPSCAASRPPTSDRPAFR